MWEHLVTDLSDAWQVVSGKEFYPCCCTLILSWLVVLSCIGCLWITGVVIVYKVTGLSKNGPHQLEPKERDGLLVPPGRASTLLTI